jgi:Protein of unknown function (DUF1566)
MNMTFILFLLTLVFMAPVRAGADLIDRGNGLIYDTDLDITWLQDAGLAARSFGRSVSWYEAQEWVANLEYGGFNDWRLPTTPGTGIGELNEGEMGHLYYSELGNPAGGPFSNTGPFINIERGYYWTGTETSSNSDSAFTFYFHLRGYQYIDNKLNGNNIWPVRDGDVITVMLIITIDIKPGEFPNSINPRSKAKIAVAILTTDTFNPTTVNAATLRFGATGTEAIPVRIAVEDVNGDGFSDLLLNFNTQDTDIQSGETSASLTGQTFNGQRIEGTNAITTLGCR